MKLHACLRESAKQDRLWQKILQIAYSGEIKLFFRNVSSLFYDCEKWKKDSSGKHSKPISRLEQFAVVIFFPKVIFDHQSLILY